MLLVKAARQQRIRRRRKRPAVDQRTRRCLPRPGSTSPFESLSSRRQRRSAERSGAATAATLTLRRYSPLAASVAGRRARRAAARAHFALTLLPLLFLSFPLFLLRCSPFGEAWRARRRARGVPAEGAGQESGAEPHRSASAPRPSTLLFCFC